MSGFTIKDGHQAFLLVDFSIVLRKYRVLVENSANFGLGFDRNPSVDKQLDRQMTCATCHSSSTPARRKAVEVDIKLIPHLVTLQTQLARFSVPLRFNLVQRVVMLHHFLNIKKQDRIKICELSFRRLGRFFMPYKC
ncbi:hypothetical protein PsorP6_015197 [Peronosclerospora sorghi]|uniref:Uncharacterized protein n=1 Tax=Peronosclerospora sorghi TaxID=230839 RepID=A0ACC0VUF2_9STRA|nr:hypothetical protein PsorP6_015197 [Peronosclerospora sorghi]